MACAGFSNHFGFTEAEVDRLFYAAASMELHTKDEIYSAMVIYGLLTYADGEVLIPNRELMGHFRDLLMNQESMGYVYRLANASKKMLAVTLCGDTSLPMADSEAVTGESSVAASK